jgi:hypothetical protein
LAIVETAGTRTDRSSIPVYFDDSRLISHFAAHDNAETTGAFHGLETDRAQSFAFLYSIAEIAYGANQTRYEISRSLLGLSLMSRPSESERRDLLRTVGELNEQHELFLRYATGFLDTWDDFEEQPESLPPGDYSDNQTSFRAQVAQSLESLGECVYEPHSRYWEPRLSPDN